MPATRLKPSEIATELAKQLSTRSRHVVLFLGAGAPHAAGLPTAAELKDIVMRELNAVDHPHFADRELEAGLSRIRRLISLLADGEVIEGYDLAALRDTDQRVCAAIIRALSVQTILEPFRDIAAWAAGLSYTRPLEIVTVNYDVLIERGLDQQSVPYFDGFVGTLRARFREDLIETETSNIPPLFARLWKLHGSVNWEYETVGRSRCVVRLGSGEASDAAAIYPSDEKYEDSRRVPFVVLMDRFRRALAEHETMAFFAGYSFRDEHLNDILFDAAERNPRNHYVCLCYRAAPEHLRERAEKTPNISVLAKDECIVGGTHSAYAPEDAAVKHLSSGKDCLLGDFANFAAFMRGSTHSSDG